MVAILSRGDKLNLIQLSYKQNMNAPLPVQNTSPIWVRLSGAKPLDIWQIFQYLISHIIME